MYEAVSTNLCFLHNLFMVCSKILHVSLDEMSLGLKLWIKCREYILIGLTSVLSTHNSIIQIKKKFK
jgi:hypothetical protein